MEPEWKRYEANKEMAGSAPKCLQLPDSGKKTALKKQIRTFYSTWLLLNILQKSKAEIGKKINITKNMQKEKSRSDLVGTFLHRGKRTRLIHEWSMVCKNTVETTVIFSDAALAVKDDLDADIAFYEERLRKMVTILNNHYGITEKEKDYEYIKNIAMMFTDKYKRKPI